MLFSLHSNTGRKKQKGVLRPYEPLLMTVLRLFDALLGAGLFLVTVGRASGYTTHFQYASILVFLLTLICFHAAGLYRSWRFSSLSYEVSQITTGCLVLYGIVVLAWLTFHPSDMFSRTALITWMILWPAVMATERFLVRTVLRYLRRQGHNVRVAVIAGAGEIGRHLANLISENPWSGTILEGFFDDFVKEDVDGHPLLGPLAGLPEYVKKEKVDIVYLSLPMKGEQKMKILLRELADTTASVYFAPDGFLVDVIMAGNLSYFDDLPILALRDTPIRGLNALLKRVEDLLLAGVALLLGSPLLVAIALGVKLSSPGPVLFQQWRYGLNGKPFQVYKFRTMSVYEDGYEFVQVTKDDPRVTRFGAFLRRTSLDELPQLVNVLKGRMSIVGPRPHPVAMNEQYRKLVPGYMLRHKVKPGITGLAQVHGCRGETADLEKMEKRVKYDLEYLRHWSLALDLKIILQTVTHGLWHENAY